MPIYEYRCGECAQEFEELVSMSAADLPRSCPRCGSTAQRMLSTFAVRVSGAAPASASAKSCSGCRKSSCATC